MEESSAEVEVGSVPPLATIELYYPAAETGLRLWSLWPSGGLFVAPLPLKSSVNVGRLINSITSPIACFSRLSSVWAAASRSPGNGGAVAGLAEDVEGRLPDFLIRVFDFRQNRFQGGTVCFC